MMTKQCSFISYCLLTGDDLSHMAVRKKLRLNLSENLIIIDSCNLKLKEPVGQGINKYNRFMERVAV